MTPEEFEMMVLADGPTPRRTVEPDPIPVMAPLTPPKPDVWDHVEKACRLVVLYGGIFLLSFAVLMTLRWLGVL